MLYFFTDLVFENNPKIAEVKDVKSIGRIVRVIKKLPKVVGDNFDEIYQNLLVFL